MDINAVLNYNPESQFSKFLEQLRQNNAAEWTWLLDMFRKRVVPWIYKKDGNLPKEAIVATNEFVEEVFANSLFRFYEIFPTGDFKSLAELRGLIFRIAELKLKEGYNKVRRDSLIYFTDDLSKGNLTSVQDNLTLEEFNQSENVGILREHIKTLNKTDQKILIRYSKGEELNSIAENLGLSSSACRKRKQRALEKLKQLVFNTG